MTSGSHMLRTIFAVLSLLALMAPGLLSCKSRGSSMKGDSNNDRILEELSGPRDGTSVTFAVSLNPDLSAEILQRDYPGELGQSLLQRLDGLSKPDVWQDANLQLVRTSDINQLQSASIREFSVQIPLASSVQNASMTVELNEEDIQSSPLLTKHFLVLAKTGFYQGAEARFFYTSYQGADVLLLGVNALSPKPVAPETPALVNSNEASPSGAVAEATRAKVADSAGGGGAGAASDASSGNELIKIDSAMTAMLGLPKWALLSPIHMVNVKQRQLNRAQRTRTLLPGDVFTVDLSDALIAAGQLIENPSILGSGFFVYLGSSPLLMTGVMANNIFTFGNIAVESRKPLQIAALKFLGRTGAGVSNQAFRIQAATTVIPRAMKSLDMNRAGVKALTRDVLSGRILFRGGANKPLGFVSAKGVVSNPLPEKQGVEPSTILSLYRRQLDKLIAGVEGNEATLVQALEPILENYRQAKNAPGDGKIAYIKSGAFAQLNQVDDDLHNASYYKRDFFGEMADYLIRDLGQLQAAKYNEPALTAMRTAGAKAQELYLQTANVDVATQRLLNSFNKFLQRWPLDLPGSNENADSLKRITAGSAIVQMLTTSAANASLFEDAADCVVNKRPLSVTKTYLVQDVLSTYPYSEVKRNNIMWFEVEHYRQLLQRLTGKVPPKVQWKNVSLTWNASNLINVDEINSYLNGKNATGASTCEMIYQGLDNLRIDTNAASFPLAGGPWRQMTEMGASRRYFAPTIQSRADARIAAQKTREASLAELRDKLAAVAEVLN